MTLVTLLETTANSGTNHYVYPGAGFLLITVCRAVWRKIMYRSGAPEAQKLQKELMRRAMVNAHAAGQTTVSHMDIENARLSMLPRRK